MRRTITILSTIICIFSVLMCVSCKGVRPSFMDPDDHLVNDSDSLAIDISVAFDWGASSKEVKQGIGKSYILLTEKDSFLLFIDRNGEIKKSFMFEDDSLCAICMSYKEGYSLLDDVKKGLDSLSYVGTEDGYTVYYDSKKTYMVATAQTPKWFNISKSQFIRRGKVNNVEYVDLGLSVNWARRNYGSYHDYDAGWYYAWGETKSKLNYYWGTYEYYKQSASGYVTDECITLNKNISGTIYDVAHVGYGGNWSMPTKDQAKELINNCTFDRVTINKQKCISATGKNGETIIFPCEGYYNNTGFVESGTYAVLWTGNTSGSGMWAYYFSVSKNNPGIDDNKGKCNGLNIRAVVY